MNRTWVNTNVLNTKERFFLNTNNANFTNIFKHTDCRSWVNTNFFEHGRNDFFEYELNDFFEHEFQIFNCFAIFSIKKLFVLFELFVFKNNILRVQKYYSSCSKNINLRVQK